MEFKEWLQLDEIRLKGLHRMFKQEHPNMPKYVQNDLYTSRIAHSFNRSLKSTSPNTSKLTASSPSDIFKLSGLKDIQWSKVPEPIKGQWGRVDGVTPADFDADTQWRFTDRRFGMREEKQIRNDAARMAKQKELMAQRGDSNEPVCVIQTTKGFKLLEGWHRTMNYLLQGAPPDQLEILRSGHTNNIDFSKWKPVKIQGYIGRGKDMQAALAGTGQYVPESVDAMAKSIGIDISKFDKKELLLGIKVEKEHDGEKGKDVDVVKKKSDLLKIAIAHLREDPKYYSKLKSLDL